MVGQLFSPSNPKKVAQQQTTQPESSPPERNVTTWDVENLMKTRFRKWWHFVFIPLVLFLIVLFLIILLPVLDQWDVQVQHILNRAALIVNKEDSCRFEIVESIPEGLVYANSSVKHISTFETWKNLIQIAEHSIEIGSFYWTLSQSSQFPAESSEGNEIYEDLMKAGLSRNISIRIAQSKPSKNFEDADTMALMEKGAAVVKFLDFDALIGSGILHTKFWIVDRKHLYLGSANLDWRALTQVKELGVAFYNCSTVVQDMSKIFDVYWMAGNTTTLPTSWPSDLSTVYNSENPFSVTVNGENNRFYFSSSPSQLNPSGRTNDLTALLTVIRKAKKFIHISVMEYLPLVVFSKGLRYWPDIDNELRKAVIERHVEVRLLISHWKKTKPMMGNFLKSLFAVNKFKKNAVLEIRWFEVPSNGNQNKIPFARVNHNKYMVTDNGAFIGTSNWSGDYFISTAGVSLVSSTENGSSNAIQQQLKDVFDRDWNSTYAKPLLSHRATRKTNECMNDCTPYAFSGLL